MAQRATVALKTLTMRHPQRGRSSGRWLMPNTSFDYERAVGDGMKSSLIMACAMWVARTFPEAPLVVQEQDAQGIWQTVPGHGMTDLIEQPNSFYTGVELWMATLLDYHTNGNAYWIKGRNAANNVIELWWTPWNLIEPKAGSEAFISHYEYKPDPARPAIRYDPSDIVHFRYGIDPQNPRRGLSPIASLLREVFTDDEAANFSASLLRNLGIPGVIISPADPDSEANVDDLEEVKEVFQRAFGGDNRGAPMVMRTRTDVKILSFSPQELDLKSLRRLPEERVTAVLGIPAVVVGLGAGLDRSTFGNFGEAREAAFESNIAPLHRQIAASTTLQLLSDFEGPRTRGGKRRAAKFDTTDVRILQEDRSRKSKYITSQYEATIIDRWTSKVALGLPVTELDRVYKIKKAELLIPSSMSPEDSLAQLIAAGTPAPAPPSETT